MNDQAENLRKVMAAQHQHKNTQHQPIKGKNTRIISVISGKGGVGKSNITLNFALSLAEQGHAVVMFDLDIGMANLDILMGQSPKYTIIDMIEHELQIEEIMEEGPSGIQYIAGGTGLSKLYTMDIEKKHRFTAQLERLRNMYDFILFDMGAGASNDSLSFILASSETVLVTTPEPTSITDAYAMIKYIHARDKNLTFHLLINRADSKKEGNITAYNLQRVTRRFLGKELSYLGTIPYDQVVMSAVKNQTPFLLLKPTSKASKAIRHSVSVFLDGHVGKNEPTFAHFLHKMKRFFK